METYTRFLFMCRLRKVFGSVFRKCRRPSSIAYIYFHKNPHLVDSITSYDDRMQDIARATAKILAAAGINFEILGSLEKDSGNEVRRFGEERNNRIKQALIAFYRPANVLK